MRRPLIYSLLAGLLLVALCAVMLFALNMTRAALQLQAVLQ